MHTVTQVSTQVQYIVVVVPDTGGTRPSVWDYNYFVVCCHPDPLLHPPDTTTPLLARYFLIKIWLPGNRLQMYMYHSNL